MLIMFAATVTVGAKTPEAVPAEAEGAAGMTPAEMDAMATENVASAAEHKTFSSEHFGTHKIAGAAMEYEVVRSLKAGEAEEAHTRAANAHDEAMRFATVAAASRQQANTAAAARDAAKALMEEKQTAEGEAREVSRVDVRVETQTTVTLETKEDASKTTKAEKDRAEEAQNVAKGEQKTAEDKLYFALKASEDANQKLAALEEDAAQKATTMDDTTAQFDAATAKLNTLMAEEVELKDALGTAGTNSATEQIKAGNCKDDQKLAKEAYDTALAEASRLDAEAVRAETAAKALQETAGGLAAEAKTIADSLAGAGS